jgi:hypothetical protein
MKAGYFLLSLFLISSCAVNPLLPVTSVLDGEIRPPQNGMQQSDLRLSIYINDYISTKAKVFKRADYGVYYLKFLVVDKGSIQLVQVDRNKSKAQVKYFKRFFNSTSFQPPVDNTYKLGESITIKVKIDAG